MLISLSLALWIVQQRARDPSTVLNPADNHTIQFSSFLPLQTKLQEGNVLNTCLSVILFTGVRGCHDVISSYGQHHPQDSTPVGWHPQDDTTWDGTLQGQHPPQDSFPQDGNPTTVNKRVLLECFLVLKEIVGHMSFYGATDTPVLVFWWFLLWVSKQSG